MFQNIQIDLPNAIRMDSGVGDTSMTYKYTSCICC